MTWIDSESLILGRDVVRSFYRELFRSLSSGLPSPISRSFAGIVPQKSDVQEQADLKSAGGCHTLFIQFWGRVDEMQLSSLWIGINLLEKFAIALLPTSDERIILPQEWRDFESSMPGQANWI
jgi:hypothetical protein